MTVTLNLSEELQRFVASEAVAGQYGGPAGYIKSLIERAKQGKEKLADLLVEGLESGDPIRLEAAAWRDIRREVEQRRAHG